MTDLLSTLAPAQIEASLAAIAVADRRAEDAQDLAVVLEMRLEQIVDHRHDADFDDEFSCHKLANVVVDLARCARDVLQEGERHDLGVGYRRAAKTAATALALMRRIRHDQERRR